MAGVERNSLFERDRIDVFSDLDRPVLIQNRLGIGAFSELAERFFKIFVLPRLAADGDCGRSDAVYALVHPLLDVCLCYIRIWDVLGAISSDISRRVDIFRS